MSIYEKSVRGLMKEFVNTEKIQKDQIISSRQVKDWFKRNYPKIKEIQSPLI
jgi:hypothetical protein